MSYFVFGCIGRSAMPPDTLTSATHLLVSLSRISSLPFANSPLWSRMPVILFVVIFLRTRHCCSHTLPFYGMLGKARRSHNSLELSRESISGRISPRLFESCRSTTLPVLHKVLAHTPRRLAHSDIISCTASPIATSPTDNRFLLPQCSIGTSP